ncbi:WXG100 family type VII secretion target [Streptomyces tropicalis]
MYTKYEHILKRAHKLQGIIDSLEKGHWDGIGRSAFNEKQQAINVALQNIGKILTDVIEAMNKTRKIKDGSEDEVRAAVNKIDIHDGAPVSVFSSYHH